MRFQLTLAATLAAAAATTASAQTLTVYAYDSFVSEWGPGPLIKAGFEAQCGCTVDLIAAGDGAALLSRLQLEGNASRADVVVGLDNFLMERARDTGLFTDSGVTANYNLAEGWSDPVFVPFYWAGFAFVGLKDAVAPTSLRELADSDLTVVIQDPRSSTPGLGLAIWVRAAYGDEGEALWADLSDNILTVTPGWSEAWALFLEGEADAALSYTTSPAYGIVVDGDDSHVAWQFSEGHLVQVEVAATLAATDQPELAQAFLAYLVGPEAQGVIPETNWMLPAVVSDAPLHQAFIDGIPMVTLDVTPAEAAEIRDQAIADWQNGLAQ